MHSSVSPEEKKKQQIVPEFPEDKEDMLAVSKVFDIQMYLFQFLHNSY